MEKDAEELLNTVCSRYNQADAHITVVESVRKEVDMPLLDALNQDGGELRLQTIFTRTARDYVLWKKSKDIRKREEKEALNYISRQIKKRMHDKRKNLTIILEDAKKKELVQKFANQTLSSP